MLYLVLANLWLATHAHVLAHHKPEKFQADWSLAYSVWPGRVHFRDLEMRGRNRRVIWSATVDQGSASIDIGELFARRVRIDGLHGSGLRFRLRPRVEKPPPAGAPGPNGETGDEDEVTAPAPDDVPPEVEEKEGEAPLLPPIPGFEGLGEPIKSTKPPWTIDLDDFVVDGVHEVWLERYHYLAESPAGRFSGSVVLRLRRSVELPHFDLELAGGSLLVREEKLARLERFAARGAMEPFPTRPYTVQELTRYTRAQLELSAQESNLSALEYYLRGFPIELGGQGKITAEIGLAHGVLEPGSRLEVSEATLRLAYLTYWGKGRGSAQVRVDDQGEGRSLARLAARLDTFELGVLGSHAAHLTGRGLTVNARTENLDLSDERPQLEGEIHLPATEVPDFRVYNRLWPESFPFELRSGKAQLESDLTFATTSTSHSARGQLLLEGHGIRAALLDNEFSGDFKLTAHLASADLAEKTFALAGTRLEISGLDGHWEPKTTGWWATVDIPRGEVQLAEPRSFDLHLDARLADSSPLVAALITQKPELEWLSGLLNIKDLRLATEARLGSHRLDLRGLKLHGGEKLEAVGELVMKNKKGDAVFHLKYGPFSAAFRLRPDRTRDWKLLKSQETYDTWKTELERGEPD